MKEYKRPSSIDPIRSGPSVIPLAGLAAPGLIAGAVGYAVGKKAVKSMMDSSTRDLSFISLVPIN